MIQQTIGGVQKALGGRNSYIEGIGDACDKVEAGADQQGIFYGLPLDAQGQQWLYICRRDQGGLQCHPLKQAKHRT